MIPPIPDSNNDSIPRIRSFTTVASKSVLASHRTPSINPKKNVAKYRKFSPIILMYAEIPVSRITIPTKKLKNSGAATGNNRQSSAFVITANTIFSFGRILLTFFSFGICYPRISFGIRSLIRYG